MLLRCAAVLLLASWGAAAAGNLSDEERRRNDDSFEYVWTTIRDKYWDPAIGGLDWQAVHDRLKPELGKAHTQVEARKVLEKMLAQLHLTHFEIIPQDAYSELGDENISSGNGTAGIDLRVVSRAALVTHIDSGSAAELGGLKPGWEIVRAGKTRFAPIIEKAEKVYRASSLKPLILRQALQARLQGYPGDNLEIELRDGDGKPVTRSLSLSEPKGALSKFGFLPPTHVWIESKRIAGSVGYVHFNMFLDPGHLMPQFSSAVKECLDCSGFILDLRGNPGGIGAMAMGMAGWFIDIPGQELGTLFLRGNKLNFVISPRPEVFSGPLAILVDETSASTSEILAGGLQDLKRARIFGSRTAAAALPSAIEMLPNGDGFQYGIANYISQGGKALEGLGVTPDVDVPLTREALLAGKDPALDAAIGWIEMAKKEHAQ